MADATKTTECKELILNDRYNHTNKHVFDKAIPGTWLYNNIHSSVAVKSTTYLTRHFNIKSTRLHLVYGNNNNTSTTH